MSEISRSADLPPSRTATFPNNRPVTVVCVRAIASRSLADDADLPLESHATALRHPQLDFINQGFDIRRAGSARVDDEVGVLGRHCSPADRKSLQTARLDQTCGVVTGWIAEHRARVWLIQRLRGNAPFQKLPDRSARIGRSAGLQLEPGGGKPAVARS